MNAVKSVYRRERPLSFQSIVSGDAIRVNVYVQISQVICMQNNQDKPPIQA
jgi:hypothetical protein